jgi:uncharacterized protein (TIGR02145 family)
MNRTISLLALLLLVNAGIAQTVTIGNQVWMTKNLNVDKFRNGDPIPQAKTDAEWEAAGENQQPAWCYYDNNPSNGEKYGKLYNLYAVNDSRGLAPVGYHIPTDEEWKILEKYLDFDSKKIKSTSGWDSYTTGGVSHSGNGTNSSGFTALPAGQRSDNNNFYNIGYRAYWWCSTETATKGMFWSRIQYNNHNYLNRWPFKMKSGFSVRCLKD